MNSKVKYVSAVAILFFLTIFVYYYTDPKINRKEQHETYNTHIEDTNLSIDSSTFSSKLPIVNITTNGQTIPGKPNKDEKIETIPNVTIQATMQIFEKEDTLHTLQQKPDLESSIQIRVRGNSSRHFDKTGYLFKFLDNKGLEEEHKVMGMDKADTWVLHAPFLDKTLMRNYMWYNLSNQIMDWAPDVRYCEVFLDGKYTGLYVMEEQISVGKGRVDVSKYDERTNVSSYIVCVDRPSINDAAYLNNFTRYSRLMSYRMEVKYPGESKLTPELVDYISKDFSKFEKALYSFDYSSNVHGYKQYIDVNSFVNYLLINEISQNTDAGMFSTYLYKDITGKLKLSTWDFNNSVNNYIETSQSVEGFFMQHRTWFSMLMKDDDFVGKVISRYKDLRKKMVSNDAITTYIDDVKNYLGSAIDRNFKVWGYTFLPEKNLLQGEGREITSYDMAIEKYEKRLLERVHWMDEHIEDLYSYSHESINKKFND